MTSTTIEITPRMLEIASKVKEALYIATYTDSYISITGKTRKRIIEDFKTNSMYDLCYLLDKLNISYR